MSKKILVVLLAAAMAVSLTACNQQLADKARKLTDDLLSKVLFSASMEMKNGFARSDS